jgi:hypothetical protein
MIYKFIVSDNDGVWGSYRVAAASEKAAEKKCRETLEADTTKASLLRPFTLTLVAEEYNEKAT